MINTSCTRRRSMVSSPPPGIEMLVSQGEKYLIDSEDDIRWGVSRLDNWPDITNTYITRSPHCTTWKWKLSPRKVLTWGRGEHQVCLPSSVLRRLAEVDWDCSGWAGSTSTGPWAQVPPPGSPCHPHWPRQPPASHHDISLQQPPPTELHTPGLSGVSAIVQLLSNVHLMTTIIGRAGCLPHSSPNAWDNISRHHVLVHIYV